LAVWPTAHSLSWRKDTVTDTQPLMPYIGHGSI
jgi:hypothetical protein